MSGPVIAASASVTAYACSTCGALRLDQAKADKCCTCGKCGKKLAREKGSISAGLNKECDECSAGSRLRYARSRVRKCAQELADAKTWLRKAAEAYEAQTGKKPDMKALDAFDAKEEAS